MTASGLAIFRADASTSVGTGHVVRCRTLATALVARGWRATLVARELPDAMAAELVNRGIAVVRLAPDLRMEDEPADIARRVGSDAALIVGDSYDLDAGWFDLLGRHEPGAVRMAVDDLIDRRLPVEIILNQNLGATAAMYDGLVPEATRVLAGPRYALLRPEFPALRDVGRVRDGRIERILVFLSGGDGPDVTARAVLGLAPLKLPVDVVVGAAYPHLAQLRATVAREGPIDLHVDIDHMAELMDRADLAIGAASSASWERCALGLPTLLVTLADNQIEAERSLVAAGAAQALGWHSVVTASSIEQAVRSLRDHPDRVAAMSRAAAAVTDGRGTQRVQDEIDAVAIRAKEAS